MALRFRYRLTSREKDALLSEQAALIEAQAAELERRAARLAALEARLAKPKTTSQNSGILPSQDLKPDPGSKTAIKRRKSAHRGRPGVTRALTGDPDEDDPARFRPPLPPLRCGRLWPDAAVPPTL